MTIKSDISLENFGAWSGGRNTLDRIINEGKCGELESMLEDLYPDGMTDTQLNDLLWFDSDTVFGWLGIRTYDQILEELEDVKSELEDKRQEYEDEAEAIKEDAAEENLTVEEIEKELAELYASDYESDIEELKERISELEEELDAA